MVMVGPHEVEGDDRLQMNSKLSELMGEPAEVTGGAAAGPGRTVRAGMQYRLSVTNGHHAGAKLPYNQNSHPEVELIVHEVREVTGFPNYPVIRVRGLSMDAEMWREGDCLLIGWGRRGERTDLAQLDSRYFAGGRETRLLRGAAAIAVLAHCPGLPDRSHRNLVWDRREEVPVPIGHETLAGRGHDFKILEEMRAVLGWFLGPGWYDDPDMAGEFKKAFMEAWSAMDSKRGEISGIIKKHGWDPAPFESRLGNGPGLPSDIVPSR